MAHKTDRWVRPYFAKYRKPLVLALLLGLAAYACAALLMFFAGYLITGTAEQPYEGIYAVYYPIVFVQVFGLAKPIARYFERLESHDWVFRMTSDLRVRLYRIIERHTSEVRERYGTGDFLGLIAEDIGHLQNLYLRTVFPTVVAWLLYALALIVLGRFDLTFALVMALVLGVTVFLMPLVSLLANRARIDRRKAQRNRLYRELTDNVLGAADWVFAGRGDEYLTRYEKAAEQVRRADEELDRYARRNDLIAALIFGIGACLVLLWAGGMFGGQPDGAENLVAAFALAFFPLVEAFSPLSMAATQSNTYRDSIARLNDLPEKEAGGEKMQGGSVANEEAVPVPSEMDIEVRGLSFAYPGSNHPVLDGIDLRIPAGQKLAILGRSGGGKSTLVALMHGDLAPTSGSVAIGGTAADRLGDTLPRRMTLVSQQPYLFNRTLRENLRIGCPDATDDRLLEALQAMGLGELVKRLPRGLDTMADEAGMRFSGGERHRIALARVLLANAPIVVLDEPAVGLDPLVERDLMDAMMHALEGRTCIVVTHHLQGIESFDRVIFLEDGRIELDGSPAELEQKSERFRRLRAFDRGIETA